MREDEKLPFTVHLEELRSRLIKCFIAIGVGFCVAYGFKEKLFEILSQPLRQVLAKGETFIFTGVTEAFFTYLKIAFIAGIILAIPVIIYQFWMFIAPGLYKNERKLILPIVFISTIFFVAGTLFAYFIVFPFGFKFLISYASDSLRVLPSMKEYLGLSIKFLFAFGMIFEIPIIITFLARMGIVSVDFLKKNRKYSILIIFVAAAILTPPDVVTQMLMAGPLMLLYEISVIGARIFGKKKNPISEAKAPEGKEA